MSDPIQISPTWIPWNQPANPQPAPAGEARARQAIAQAARRTGVDFNYLLAQAKLESSLDADARANRSSASGLYQFIDSTWLDTLDRHGESIGLGSVAAAIDTVGGQSYVSDPAQRAAIMALRFDPETSALMAGALANDNRAALTGVLGREPDSAELYLAHFLGAGGARKLLGQLSANPDFSAAAVLPNAASANRSIFYRPGGEARSVSEVMEVIRSKMARSMEGGSMPLVQFAGRNIGAGNTPSQSPSVSRISSAAGISAGTGSSMADTLKSSFALADGLMPERARNHVRTAYAALQAFKL